MTEDRTILIKNIYYMLSYAFRSLHLRELKEIAVEEFHNIQNLFAAILSKGISYQLKQGLHREYKNIKEETNTVHGKIDIKGSLKNRFSRKPLINCEYDNLLENNLLNQILKTTVLLLLNSDEVKQQNKNILKREIMLFNKVDKIDPRRIDWKNVYFNQQTKSYQVLIGICQLVLEGLLLTTDTGDFKLASFIDDQQLYQLFEKFVLEYYKKEHPELSPSSSRIPWATDNESNSILPIMQCDVMLQKDKKILIIDTKYYTHILKKHFNFNTLNSGNLYQIYTYVENKKASSKDEHYEVSGILLYAKTEEPVELNEQVFIDGNKFSIKTLNLNKKFKEIVAQLEAIVQDHFD